jgi:hypothetical protein
MGAYGAVAQLGEHCVRIARVRGSIPLSSISRNFFTAIVQIFDYKSEHTRLNHPDYFVN